MIVPVFLDVSEIAAEFSLTEGQINNLKDKIIKDITAAFFYEWSLKAKEGLGKTRNRYLSSLYVVDEGFLKGAVVLDYADSFVRMLEEGATPYDMKPFFKSSSKVKFNKDGDWYLNIPFRYAAADSLGESEIFSGILPQEVYDVAVKQETDIPMGSGFRSSGLKVEQLPEGFRKPTTRAAIPATEKSPAFEEYKRKTAKFQGLIKKKDGTTGQTSGYMTFRRVSENSDKNAWIHPGLPERNFAEKALNELDVEGVMDKAIDNYLYSM